MKSFRKNLKWYLLGGLFLANLLIWNAIFAESHGDVLTVAFLDVGQGDAIFIESPAGVQVLIDGGPNKAVLRELGRVMPYYDRSIDVIIATHPDTDHIGGLASVMERFHVAYVLESGAAGETGVYRAFESALTRSAAARRTARRGTVVDLGSGARLEILFPDRDASGMESNDASIVARLVYGETEVLLTGDAPQNIERYLVSLDGHELASDILKVGHHGSKTSTAELFVGFVAPDYAIISAGKNNRYGHPHETVVDTLARFGVAFLNTADSGTIVFQSDGERVWKK